MMTKNGSWMVKFALALGAVVLLSGCQVASAPVAGLWMQNVGHPVSAGDTVGDKEGKSCVTSYFGVFAQGDASIKAAAEAGGITRIASVDAETTNMIVIGTYCTVVRGS